MGLVHIDADRATLCRVRDGPGLLVDDEELGRVVLDGAGRLHPLPDDRHVALDDGVALAAELLDDLGAHLLADRLGRGSLGDLVDVADDRSDEGDAHHPELELGTRGVLLRHAEGVDDEEVDPLGADGAAGVLRQLAPDLFGRAGRTGG